MSERERVAQALEEIARSLELLGESFFKVRAYDNGARIVRELEGELRDRLRGGSLQRLEGIGPALAEKIETLVTTGSLPYLDDLRRQMPPGLLEWLRVPGLGPKKIRAIHLALGISTLEELAEACSAGRVRALPGFGPATERRIAQRVQRLREGGKRFLYPLAAGEAERLLALVRAVRGVNRAEVAGDVRRRAETTRRVELVAASSEPAAAIGAFCEAEGVAEVLEREERLGSVRLAAGPQARLRVVSDETFAAALVRDTGSGVHLEALDERAAERGLVLSSEEGLLSGGERGATVALSEKEIYAALGLNDAIPPELREGTGEIEAAASGALPRLVEDADLVGVLHVHTRWSDGKSTIAEMVEAARAMGLSYLGVTDHSKAASYAGGLDADRVRLQHGEIDELNRSYDGAFTVLKGIEVDVLPDGTLDFADEVLAQFDVVFAALHSALSLEREAQTGRVLRALDNPWVDVLAHPTGRRLTQRRGCALDLERVFRRAAERGVALEVNSHPERLDLDWRNLRDALAQGVVTCIAPDAHAAVSLYHMHYGVGVARKAWCTPDDVLNARPLDELMEHLGRRRREAGARGGRWR